MNRDPGLQPERTQLSWQRTILSGLGLALLAARKGICHPAFFLVTISSLSAALYLMAMILLQRNKRVLPGAAPITATAMKVLVCTAVCLTALALLLHIFNVRL